MIDVAVFPRMWESSRLVLNFLDPRLRGDESYGASKERTMNDITLPKTSMMAKDIFKDQIAATKEDAPTRTA